MRALPDPVCYFARTRAGKTACVDLGSGAAYTYAALDACTTDMAERLVALLARDGRAPAGERVAALARNSSELVCLYLACLRAGLIFQPLNWRLAAAELAMLVEDAAPAFIVHSEEFGATARALAAGALSFEALADSPRAAFARAERDAEAPATLLYTSGTTGRPKGVIVTEANAQATALNYALAANVGGESVFLCDMPMFHVVGLFAVTRSVLQMGATLLISPAFDADETVRRIADRALGITHYFCVPQMAQQMRQSRLYEPALFARLSALQTGGAPHAAASVRAWLHDGVMLIDGYGMSEAGTVLGMPPGDLDLLGRKAGAAGLPAIGVEVRLVDRESNDVGEGEIGEVWVRGPSVSPGYWRNPEATDAAFRDGWFRSGDAARRDGDGFYTLVDRWKDMFISGGENVYPAEVEAAILEIDGVAEGAVIGAPDPRWGETGVAFVVCRAGAAIAGEQVIAHCRARLAAYKAPKYVVLTEGLPRTASGKVQKAALREIWARGKT
jgi:fatty-acyl-CoA synthase